MGDGEQVRGGDRSVNASMNVHDSKMETKQSRSRALRAANSIANFERQLQSTIESLEVFRLMI
jgi:hypothetical protein